MLVVGRAITTVPVTHSKETARCAIWNLNRRWRRFYRLSSCCELYSTVAGFHVNKEKLRGAAVRIWDALKGLNQAKGFGPEADRPPDIWFEPMKGEKGEPLVLRDYFGHSALGRNEVK